MTTTTPAPTDFVKALAHHYAACTSYWARNGQTQTNYEHVNGTGKALVSIAAKENKRAADGCIVSTPTERTEAEAFAAKFARTRKD